MSKHLQKPTAILVFLVLTKTQRYLLVQNLIFTFF